MSEKLTAIHWVALAMMFMPFWLLPLAGWVF